MCLRILLGRSIRTVVDHGLRRCYLPELLNAQILSLKIYQLLEEFNFLLAEDDPTRLSVEVIRSPHLSAEDGLRVKKTYRSFTHLAEAES